MTTAIASFLRVYDHSPAPGVDATRLQVQNFFTDKSVIGHDFASFTSSEIVINRTADEGGITLQFAATSLWLSFFKNAIISNWLAEYKLYEMPADNGIPKNLNNATLIARFVGEVVTLSTDLTSITVEVGASIDAVSGEIPGRKVTTSVVGRLPTL